MTVQELITHLSTLPQDLEVFHNWEGELHPTKWAGTVTAKRYSPNGTLWTDYYSECELDEGEERLTVCFVGSSSPNP